MRNILTIAFLAGSIGSAIAVTGEDLDACGKAYRKFDKEAKLAAPAGFKPDRPRGFRNEWLAKCLSK